MMRPRSERRRDEADHTRITLVEDDVDVLEARVGALEEKEHARVTHEAVLAQEQRQEAAEEVQHVARIKALEDEIMAIRGRRTKEESEAKGRSDLRRGEMAIMFGAFTVVVGVIDMIVKLWG